MTIRSAGARFRREGFTLVEVALAVAVGLIIIGGAVLGYNAVKDNASNSGARNRVMSGVTMVEEFASANGGVYPTSSTVATGGSFSQMWKQKRPEDYSRSPWGGFCGAGNGLQNDGVVEAVATAFTTTDLAAASATNATTTAFSQAATVDNHANLIYVSNTSTSNPWATINMFSTQQNVAVKNYALGINDKTGNPWWDVKGGK